MSDSLSTDCETRARARAWIEKFDAADGRYISRMKKELAAAVTATQETKPKEKRVKVDHYSMASPPYIMEESAIYNHRLERWLMALAQLNGIPWRTPMCFRSTTTILNQSNGWNSEAACTFILADSKRLNH